MHIRYIGKGVFIWICKPVAAAYIFGSTIFWTSKAALRSTAAIAHIRI